MLALRRVFLTGLLVLVPLLITVKALSWLFQSLDGLAQPLAERFLGRQAPGLGLALTVALVLLTGLVFSVGPLRRVLEAGERLLDAVPLAGTVYGTTKKVLAGLGSPEGAFKRFVLARLPGRTTPGFVTGTFSLRMDGRDHRVCTVYVPTNHLYVGDVVVLPEEDVVPTDLSVEDGIGLVLSGGASVPARVIERR